MPVPEVCYASPLKRALDTWARTFDRDGAPEVLVKERRKVLILEVRADADDEREAGLWHV